MTCFYYQGVLQTAIDPIGKCLIKCILLFPRNLLEKFKKIQDFWKNLSENTNEMEKLGTYKQHSWKMCEDPHDFFRKSEKNLAFSETIVVS